MRELERLAGAVICCGVPARLDGAALEALGRLRPGGIILFERNVVSRASARAAVETIVAVCGEEPPPLIGVDQEGGRVARLRGEAVSLPSMMALGDRKSVEYGKSVI